MILIIDNNDSFTYNIAEMLRNITDEKIDIIKHDNADISAVARYNRIIFSPGPSLPQEYPVMERILRAYGNTIPILGICLGYQAICLHYGGKLVNTGKVMHGVPSPINCESRSLLFKGIRKTTVGRYHSWIACDIPSQLKITATTGDGLPMAVEHVCMPVYGVQFHPESYMSEDGELIFKNFINEHI